MIPYPQFPRIELLGQTLHVFSLLAVAGMVLCYLLSQWRLKKIGLFAPAGAAALVWATTFGFIGAHVFDALAYFPERVAARPQYLFELWSGMSSFGGFIGASLGVWMYCRRHGLWTLAYWDGLMFGFVPGWIVARTGCFFAHDHPGVHSDFVLAVAYPGGARHDLGLYEALLALAITVVLYVLGRGDRGEQRRFVGFYTALVVGIYAPVRFMFDVLRVADRRYLGLTPAQYLCVVLVAVAVWLVWKRDGHDPRTTGGVEVVEGDG